MDLVKTQLTRIQQQLAGLSASQKMLTASLLAIIIMTLGVFYLGIFPGQVMDAFRFAQPVVSQLK